MSKAVGKPLTRLKIKKRTSIGNTHFPKNKHKRRSWKPYRGQG